MRKKNRARGGISLWNIKKKKGAFSACVAVEDYKKLLPFARKAKLRLRVTGRHGFPFFLKKFKNRAGVFVGILCFFAVINAMSLFIWSVDVSGNVEIADGEVICAMEELGLSSGVLRKKINVPRLEQEAMIKMPKVAWLSVNLEGSRATVCLNERIAPPEIVPKAAPCNIKAAFDGQISRMEVCAGEAVVNVGDAVRKGQLLVSGVVEDAFGVSTLHHTEAKIFALTKREISAQVPLWQEKEIPTGKTLKRYTAKAFGVQVPLNLLAPPNENFTREVSRQDLRINGAKMPVTLYTENFLEQTKQEIRLTPEQAAAEAQKIAEQKEEIELKGTKILERKKSEKIDEEKYLVNFTYFCEEDIAKQEEIVLK